MDICPQPFAGRTRNPENMTFPVYILIFTKTDFYRVHRETERHKSHVKRAMEISLRESEDAFLQRFDFSWLVLFSQKPEMTKVGKATTRWIQEKTLWYYHHFKRVMYEVMLMTLPSIWTNSLIFCVAGCYLTPLSSRNIAFHVRPVCARVLYFTVQQRVHLDVYFSKCIFEKRNWEIAKQGKQLTDTSCSEQDGHPLPPLLCHHYTGFIPLTHHSTHNHPGGKNLRDAMNLVLFDDGLSWSQRPGLDGL